MKIRNLLLFSFLSVIITQNVLAEITIKEIGIIPDTNSSPADINESGNLIINTYSEDYRYSLGAYFWSETTGMLFIDDVTGLSGTAAQFLDKDNRVYGHNRNSPYIWKPLTGEYTPILLADNLRNNRSLRVMDVNNSGQALISGFRRKPPMIWQDNAEPISLPRHTTDQTPYYRAYAADINNHGDVVGYERVNGINHAIYWKADGSTIDITSGHSVSARKINDHGQIIGTTGGYSYFYWDQANDLVPLNHPSGKTTIVYDINNNGTVLGHLVDFATNTTQAFVWTLNDGFTILPSLGGSTTSATAINDIDHVLGTDYTAYDYASIRAYVWSKSTGTIELPILPGYNYSRPTKILDNGMILGTNNFTDGLSYGEQTVVVWQVNLTPEEKIEYIASSLQSEFLDTGILNEGETTSLLSKLESVAAFLEIDKTKPAINQLGAFANQIEALVNSGRISPEQGQAINSDISDLVGTIAQ